MASASKAWFRPSSATERVTVIAVLSERTNRREVWQAALPDDEVLEVAAGDDPGVAARAEVAIAVTDGRRVQALLAVAPRLRWLHSISAGVEGLVESGVVGHPGLVVTNNRGASVIPIAEHVVAVIGAAAKRLPHYERARQQRRWERASHAELRGATLVVLGIGAIGAEVARLAAALGMRVIGVRRGEGPAPQGVAQVVGPSALVEVAREADYLAICAPLTTETRGLVSAAVIERLRPTSWVINIARGPLLDEGALVAALRGKRIGGAALDVFDREPLPADHPLWDFENVILTPHASSSTPHHPQRVRDLFLDNLARFKRGEALLNVVPPGRGY